MTQLCSNTCPLIMMYSLNYRYRALMFIPPSKNTTLTISADSVRLFVVIFSFYKNGTIPVDSENE